MSSFKIRPRSRQVVQASTDDIVKLFKDRIEHDNEFCSCQAQFTGNHITISIPQDDQHYWSPQLNLTLEEEKPEYTLIRGLYGPAPSVWTLFAFGYFALGIAFLITSIFANAYYVLGENSNLIWFLPVYIVIAIGLYIIAQLGQKLGAEQTFTLHKFYEETVGKRVTIE